MPPALPADERPYWSAAHGFYLPTQNLTPGWEEADQDPPSGWLWMVYLLVAPVRFVTAHATRTTSALEPVMCLIVGFLLVIQGLANEALPEALAEQGLFERWAAFLPYAVGAGLVGGALLYLIAGSWYALRVRWSGGERGRSGDARRIYLYTSMISLLPVLIMLVMAISYGSTPAETLTEASPWWWVAAAALSLFSIAVGYRCVTRLFTVKLWAARFWFLVLPLAWFATLFGWGVAQGWEGLTDSGSFRITAHAPVPDESDERLPVQHFTNGELAFFHPASWSVQSIDDGEGGYVLLVQPQDHSAATLQVRVFRDERSPKDALIESATGLRERFDAWRPAKRGTRWGMWDGHGLSTRVSSGGRGLEVRMLVTQLDEELLMEVYEYNDARQRWKVESGLRMVRDTLTRDTSLAIRHTAPRA